MLQTSLGGTAAEVGEGLVSSTLGPSLKERKKLWSFADVEARLSGLAVDGNVAPSTQNSASGMAQVVSIGIEA